MKAKDIPEFIFRGAVLSVDGKEEVVSQLSLERPVHKGIPGPEDVLYLKFKSGLALEYSAARVQEIPGKPPEFIYKGAKIFCKYPVEGNAAAKSFSVAVNGIWEVASFHYGRDADPAHRKLIVTLSRPAGKTTASISRAFNSAAMFPAEPSSPLPRQTPVYQLDKNLSVRRHPVRFKPKGN